MRFSEQEEIAKSKPLGELLKWDDLAKMKYTWRVALEILRTIPPIFGGFRKALKDIEYGGYLIPKGWQVRFSFFFNKKNLYKSYDSLQPTYIFIYFYDSLQPF